MFRATLCSSSGESIVSIQHLVYVSLCRWPPGMQVENELDFLPGLHTGRSPAQTDIYQMYWYNWLSWWWAQGCSKPVENRNKYIWKELCVKLVIYWNYTEMHGHQNIKYHSSVCSSLCEKCHFPYNLRLLMLFRKNYVSVTYTFSLKINQFLVTVTMFIWKHSPSFLLLSVC